MAIDNHEAAALLEVLRRKVLEYGLADVDVALAEDIGSPIHEGTVDGLSAYYHGLHEYLGVFEPASIEKTDGQLRRQLEQEFDWALTDRGSGENEAADRIVVADMRSYQAYAALRAQLAGIFAELLPPPPGEDDANDVPFKRKIR